ncbi:probable protein phosphatase 2C 5 isoform X1 [Raphanus sativus]|uniref:Probable protein phosphatase 2C 5 isoform X1 n=1 Tax=Raphanus sativus TaxID=3726 RepID=A0A9W3CQ91_RAPSA|nr:probable protein phosphatase 2C 5 isoform X1 [Raphanus sativus]
MVYGIYCLLIWLPKLVVVYLPSLLLNLLLRFVHQLRSRFLLDSESYDVVYFQEALRTKGLKDDTTCVVADIVPSCVEELFEEGSAVLADRLGKDLPSNTETGLLKCPVCQIDQSPAEDVSSNEGPIISSASKRWEGPFLCTVCKKKKDAMEGKRPSKGFSHHLKPLFVSRILYFSPL